MLIPKEGTPGWEIFLNRAKRNPNSMEGRALAQMYGEATDQTQQHLRGMLQQMIELVPGQLFKDVVDFHQKFQLQPTEDPGHKLPDDILQFRARFMLEELTEYLEAIGHELSWGSESGFFIKKVSDKFDAEKAFDSLLDELYVVLGTAYLHRFPVNQGWQRVQDANMAKVRADGADDERSHRKHSVDIVKPSGWEPPVLSDLLGPKKEEEAASGAA